MIEVPVWYLTNDGTKVTRTISVPPPTTVDDYAYILDIYGEVAKAFNVPERSIQHLAVHLPETPLYQLEIYRPQVILRPDMNLQLITSPVTSSTK